MKRLGCLLAGIFMIVTVLPAAAQEAPAVETVLSAMVAVQAQIPAEARTAESLGLERQGHGVVIDEAGLVLTIGYLILEADSVTVTTGTGDTVPARVVAYDYATGFGLVRASEPLGVTPIAMARTFEAAPGDAVMVAGFGGIEYAMVARIVSRRPFAGYWEYLLEEAVFTSPPYPVFGGAALISREGRLLGIGSLFVNDAAGPEIYSPGNMFVPIDLLHPILDDLVATGRSKAPRRPWLGMYSGPAERGLLVSRVSQGGPADKAGLLPGSIVMALEGRPIESLEDFYRKLWALGPPGTVVRLTVIDPRGEARDVEIVSGDRHDWLAPGAGN